MRRESSKLSLWLIAAILLVSTAAQVALSSDVTADKQRDGAPASQAPEPEEMPNFDAATKLLMWVQQNQGVVSWHRTLNPLKSPEVLQHQYALSDG